jgi:hypothetical protein
MKQVLSRLIGRFADLGNTQPLLALFLGAAFLCVFLTVTLRRRPRPEGPHAPSLVWTLYRRLTVFTWACSLVAFLLGGLSVLRTYLHQAVASFQHSHGRITEANYNAVQTIWGSEQVQAELNLDLYWEETVTNRFQPEDITKPAILRRKVERHTIESNPFISARHEVTLRQNARKKGSALYGGYETACRFSWRLKNPADRDVSADIRFPLPADGAVYDDLYATVNGQDVLPQMRLDSGALVLSRPLKPAEVLDMSVGFKSRGMSYWYMQIKEAREIRDFTLTLNLPDLPKARLNYPDDCMTPTDIKPTPDGLGSLLTFRLDHAISSKGMGISLPTLPQPGQTTNAVLSQIERSWMLIYALLILGLTVASVKHSVVISLMFGAAAALGYGMLGDFSDLLFGFWGTAALVLTPTFVVLAWLLKRCLPGRAGVLLAGQFLVYGIVLPCAAGLDGDRELLYLDICAAAFLAFIAWQLLQSDRLRPMPESVPTTA